MDQQVHTAIFLALAENLSRHLSGPTAHRLADLVELHGIDAVSAGEVNPDDEAWVQGALRELDPGSTRRWLAELEQLAVAGVEVVTIGDAHYPVNLRMIHNRPPVLFVRGQLEAVDQRALAVVGTRNASDEGLRAAERLAAELAQRNVTVVSGLARGIDTAAHVGALNASGRTIAVLGTGISRQHPKANTSLARAIERSGACVSQFWPDQGGTRWTFPLRNIVTSGLSLGTVVVEAGATSGAKLQAHDALKHGKRLFLLRSLVLSQPWAEEMSRTAPVRVIDDIDEVVAAVDTDLDVETELELAL